MVFIKFEIYKVDDKLDSIKNEILVVKEHYQKDLDNMQKNIDFFNESLKVIGDLPFYQSDDYNSYNGNVLREYKNLDIGGIDSYDQDSAGASDSLGSAIIYRRFLDTYLRVNQVQN